MLRNEIKDDILLHKNTFDPTSQIVFSDSKKYIKITYAIKANDKFRSLLGYIRRHVTVIETDWKKIVSGKRSVYLYYK